MANYEFFPNRSDKNQDDSKTEKESSKRKKVTKVPLGYVYKTVESTDAKNDYENSKQTEISKNPLEKLFEKRQNQTEETDETAKETTDDLEDESYDKSELAELSGADYHRDELGQQDLENNQEAQTESETAPNIEGEFVDEMPVVVTRGEVTDTTPDDEPIAGELGELDPEPADRQTNQEELADGVEPGVNELVPEELPENTQELNVDRSIYEYELQQHQNYDHDQPKRQTVMPETTLVTEDDVNEAYYRGKKQGTSRGVVAGGLFGWWLGRRGKKAATKEAKFAKAEAEKQQEQIKQLEAEQLATKERLSAMKASNENLESALRKTPEEVAAEKVLHRTKDTRFDNIPEITPTSTPEKMIESLDNQNKLQQKPEVIPEEKEITEDMYTVKNGRRVETSAWHSVEVDEKTGRAVSDPERAYGKEFVNEQKQEKLSQLSSDPGLAIQFGSTAIKSVDDKDIQTDTSVNTENQSSNSKGLGYIKRQALTQASNPITWIVAVIVFIFLIIFGILS